MTHVLLIHQAFVALDQPGGTRHHELARNLAQRGHQITIIASPVSYLTGKSDAPATNREDEFANGRVTILRTYTYSALHKSFVHRVFSFVSFMVSSFWAGLKVKQVDLLWGTSPPIFQGITAWALACLKGVPFLFEVRDLWPAFAVEVGVLRNPLLIRLSEWLERFLYRNADLVMVNSPGFLTHVQQRGARRVELVPNGVDTEMFDPAADGENFRVRNGLVGKYVVLYAGAHGMSNDLEILLQAASFLSDHLDIAIVLLGDGKEKPALIAQSEALNLVNVIFLPPVTKVEMGQALAAADACVAILKPIPLYATVYPNKVFDYMAAGRPVILAIDGVIREVIEKNSAGIYVPPGDPELLSEAILTLFNDREKGKVMGLNGRKAVEGDFDRARLADKLVEIIAGLTQPKQSS